MADEWRRCLSGDLAEALREDHAAEERGMHGDRRRTCWTCQSWADHVHGGLTGDVLYDDGREVRRDGTEVRR